MIKTVTRLHRLEFLLVLNYFVSLFRRENCVGEVTRTLTVLREVCAGATLMPQDALVAQYAAHVISNRAAQLVSVCEYITHIH